MTTKTPVQRGDDMQALLDMLEGRRPQPAEPAPAPTKAPALPWWVPSGNRVVAVIVWLIGVATTYLGFVTMLPDLPWTVALPFALACQGMLTWMERGIWRGRHITVVTMAALLIDVLLNAGGLYPYMARLGATPPARMLADAFGWGTTISPIGAIVIALIGGFLIAAAPEEYWNRRD